MNTSEATGPESHVGMTQEELDLVLGESAPSAGQLAMVNLIGEWLLAVEETAAGRERQLLDRGGSLMLVQLHQLVRLQARLTETENALLMERSRSSRYLAILGVRENQ